MSLLWINGQFVDKADARISPFDHGFLYGDGVWEPLRLFGGRLFRLDDHIRSLFQAADVLDLVIPLAPEELVAAVEATVRANGRTEGYVRVIVTRGPGTIGPDPRKLDPQILILAEEYFPFPTELYGHGLHAAVPAVRTAAIHPAERLRVLGRPWISLAKQQALKAGCLEAVILESSGRIAGCTEGNLLLVQGGAVRDTLSFPPEQARLTAAELARECGILVTLQQATLPDLLAADEAFLAGTSCGVIAIIRVAGQDIGTGTEGPVTRTIREAFRRVTRGE